jgi:hypothetical protein
MSPAGTLQVVTRGTDNYVYYTGQTAPGSSAYAPWRTVTMNERASSDPTAIPTPDSWIVGYISDIGEPRIRLNRAPTPPSVAPTFAEL